MKKKIMALSMAVLAVAVITAGCGGNGNSNSGSSVSSGTVSGDTTSNVSGKAYTSETVEKAKAAVKLGEYKGIKVHVPNGDNPTEQELSEYAENFLFTGTKAFIKDDSKTVVEADSIVNVNYMGLLDGVAFEGGTAKDVFIDVKGNSDAARGSGYIPGFTAGLVGAKVGDTVDSPVTFPTNYSENLAGKDVIFRFDVNYICRRMTKSDLTDEYAKENFGLNSAADFDSFLKEQYKRYASEAAESLKRQAVMEAVLNAAEFDSSVAEADKLEYAFLAVAAKEGLELDEDGYGQFLENYMYMNGFSDKDAFLKAVGDDQMFKDLYISYKAIDLCEEIADVI